MIWAALIGHYGNLPDLALAIGDVLAKQVSQLDADVVQIEEANLPGSPDEWRWAAAAINRVLMLQNDPGSSSLFWQLCWTIKPKGPVEELDRLSQCPSCGSYCHGNRAPRD
jgi:hypothetical protein